MDGIGLVQLLPGAREFILWLAERGHAVVLSSSAKAEELEVYLEMLDVGDAVAGHTTSADVENTKPEPDVVEAALELLGRPEAAVMVGDSVFDVHAAGRAGLPTVAAAHRGLRARRVAGGRGGGRVREPGRAPRTGRQDPAHRLTGTGPRAYSEAHASINVDRRHLLRARQRARQDVLRGLLQERPLPPAPRGGRRPRQAEARVLDRRRGGPLRGDRQGLRDRPGLLRDRHPGRARRARPEGHEDDRHRGLRRPRGRRPHLLRPRLLPRPGHRRGQELRAPARGHAQERQGRRGPHRHAPEAVPVRAAPHRRRRHRHVDDELRRRGRRPRARSTSSTAPTRSRPTTARSRWPSS